VNIIPISDIQDYIEKNSLYAKLLTERYINKEKYKYNLKAMKQGLDCLGLPSTSTKVFENRDNFIIWLGHRLTEYKGYELPLYIGHKKMGLPIPEGLIEKCPSKIISLIERTTERQHIYEYNKELRDISFSIDIFLGIHECLMCARVEKLLPDLLADVDRLGFISVEEALKKVPQVYTNYLSPASFAKLIKKIASHLRDMRGKFEEELKSIDLYSLRLKEQLEGLYVETSESLKSIMERDVETGADINVITKKISNLFSRLDRLFLGNIYHLKDYETRREYLRKSLRQEDELVSKTAEKRLLGRRKKISEICDEFIFFNQFGALDREEHKFFVKSLTHIFEQLHKKKSRDVSLLHKFEKRGLLSVGLDLDGVLDTYDSFMKKILIPQYVGQCFLDIVQCLPPFGNETQRVVYDLGNLKTLNLSGSCVLELLERHDYPEHVVDYAKTFAKSITILVYDIRGSSYMGTKLNNAVKEQKIKYKFAKEMAEIVKKYGGFLLKDTGDGGLVWFSENSNSLYNHLYAESVTGRGMKLRYSIFSGAEFELIPAQDAAKRAILCARDMVQRAEEFIRANFMHYREWFADVAERTLELDGITYALLPPEFKSLFRIGIGIASGRPGKDVVLAANSFGDPDLVGPVLSDAHLYSMERQPGRSVIICDFPTVTNMILNSENFEFPVDEKDFEKYVQAIGKLRLANHGYKFSDHKIMIVPKGVHFLEELDKKKAVADARISDVSVDKSKNIFNEQQKKIKLVYEVLNI
jgi:class 3 adenylate cyclase